MFLGTLQKTRNSPANGRRRARSAVAMVSWLYALGLLGIWAVMRFWGDRWWPCTLMLFGPRWVCAMPLLVLLPGAAWVRSRVVWLLCVAAAVAILPIMGFCIPWRPLVSEETPTIRILTCNLKGHCEDNAALEQLLRETAPDLVALQGCWRTVTVDWPDGWQVRQEGASLIASRYPLGNSRFLVAEDAGSQTPRPWLLECQVRHPVRTFRFVAVHLPSPHRGITELLDRHTLIRPSRRGRMETETAVRQRASAQAQQWIATLPGPLIMAGDLNLPTDSTIYRQHWADFSNAFSTAGFGFGLTEWPYVRGRWFGTRIDHILTSPPWQSWRCWVGPDVGSDHRPLIADIGLR